MGIVLRGICGLLLAALGVGLAWWLSNRWDVAPQPLPAALALPTDAPPADGVLQVLDQAPKLSKALNTPNCRDLECADAWRKALPDLLQAVQAQPAFGQACEAAIAREPLQVVEALPETWTPTMSIPGYTSLTNCGKNWWVQAMAASEAGEAEAALAALRRSDRLAKALLQGARMPYGHMTAHSLLARQLRLIVVIAERQPALRPQLLPLAEIDGAALMASTRRWILTEAAFGRGAVDSIQTKAELDPTTPAPGRAFLRLVETGWQPEYAKQLMNTQWLRALEASRGDDPQAALRRHEALWQAEPGWFGSSFHWFHTVPHLLHDVALPTYIGNFQRPADLQLASQATLLWLRGGRPEQAEGTLRERLSLESNGSWRLRLWTTDSNSAVPSRWPAPT